MGICVCMHFQGFFRREDMAFVCIYSKGFVLREDMASVYVCSVRCMYVV